MRNNLLLLILILANLQLNAQDILGKWKTIDDETGEPKSVVEIYEKEGKIYGKIVDILTKNRDAICKKCDGENKNQPILGLEIINGLEKDDAIYEGGTILNPENGKVYKCRLKLEEDTDTLQVRGYIAFLYKTQYWKRVIE
ncbi:hypothetical protein BWZ20_14270 [Winogradskyella sp. J14-2]|uniref:DUF2147 domain-containing protein n=1 Tax=Winogradskyella sp. J14-2 TaxID=1936080 RepID=UPI000972A95E|nr:DUF2147 domain-containing protein [Winogradskyella sp. J14-2]APY09399.1 hypothetical protein BWZ20_14270 [Winogradskyella sp. J14-2]